MTHRVELLCDNSSDATSQIYTGFGLLHRARIADVKLIRERDYDAASDGAARMKAVVDGRRVFFDLHDGGRIDDDALAWSDVYFKRSYDRTRHGNSTYVHPLGLNLPMYGPGDWRWRRAFWSLRGMRPKNVRSVSTRIALLNRPLARVLPAKSGAAASMLGFMEREPVLSDRPRVILFTRTWDPERVGGKKADEWRAINWMRANCIRALRSEFGPDFIGGLAPLTSALRDYPDCVVDSKVVVKATYLGSMHGSDVGIATTGLRGSNGWPMAEYVAAAKAIVSQPLNFEVPGPFLPERTISNTARRKSASRQRGQFSTTP